MADSGVLQFALGLETGGYINNISRAEARTESFKGATAGAGAAAGKFGAMLAVVAPELLAFAAGLFSIDKAIHGIEDSMERGTELKHLSEQTGEAVGNLYQLQEGLKAVGLSGQELPNLFLRINDAVSGLGGSANNRPLLTRIGLDPATLRQMDPAKQIDAIVAALSKLDHASAEGAASQLFGSRTGALPFMQIVGSAEEFHNAMQAAAQDGSVFEKYADTFGKFDAAVISIKGHFEAFFAEIAGGLVPGLEEAADFLNKMDGTLLSMGAKISNLFRGFAEAVKEGHVEDLLGAAFDAAAERLGNILFSPNFWYGFSDAMIGGIGAGMVFFAKAILNIGILLKSVLDEAFQQLFEALGKIPKIGHFLGLDNFHADSFANVYNQNQKANAAGNSYLSALGNFGGSMFAQGMQELGKAITQSGNGPAEQKFNSMLAGLTKNAPTSPGAGAAAGAGATTSDLEKSRYKPEFTDLEKMGFVMSGLGHGYDDQKIGILTKIEKNTQPRTTTNTSADPSGGATNTV